MILQKNWKYDEYQCGLVSVVYNFFDKKTSNKNKGTEINSDIVSENEELAQGIRQTNC